MASKSAFQRELRVLRDQYTKHRKQYEGQSYNETELRNEFLNKMFLALGWDVDNTKGLAPHEREVLLERGDCQGRRPDYNFRIAGRTCFYLEAKAPHAAVGSAEFAYQAKRYSWSTTESIVPIAVLSNFKEILVFDTTLEPDYDYPERGLIFRFSFEDYDSEKCIDRLWQLSRSEMQEETLLKSLTRDKSRETFRIRPDDRLLDLLNGFRLELGSSIFKKNKNVELEQIHDVVGTLINRLIFIRVLEDRGTIDRREMKDLVDDWEEAHGKKGPLLIKMIRDEFTYINANFNGKLFDGDPLADVKIDADVLAKVIKSLYGRKCPFAFNRLDINTLGHIYEQFLSKQLVKSGRGIALDEKQIVRDAGGVFYTPREIVAMMCEESISPVVEGSDKVSDVRVLDPACGSGTFLITAYKLLLKEAAIRASVTPEELPFSEKKDLLLKCIFGVDIDREATKVAVLSLCLAALEGEPHISKGKRLLPNLRDNIVIRDSLIQKDLDSSRCLDIKNFPLKGRELCIVGNPPYLNVKRGYFDESYKRHIEENYEVATEHWDTYAVFIERALQWKPAALAFIVPKPILTNATQKEVRKVLAPSLNKIIDVGMVFQDASVETVVLSCSDKPKNKIESQSWKDGETSTLGKIERKTLMDGNSINIYADPDIEEIFSRIEQSKNRLKDNVIRPVLRGVEKGKNALVEGKAGKSEPCLSGAEVTTRTAPKAKKYIKVNWNEANIFKEEELYSGPKVLLRRVASSLLASVDYSNSLCLNTLYVIKPNSDIDHEVLAGYLNSVIIKFWFKYKYVNDDKLFPYVRTVQVSDTPLPKDLQAFNKKALSAATKVLDFDLDHSGKEANELDKIIAQALGLTMDDLKKITAYMLKMNQLAA